MNQEHIHSENVLQQTHIVKSTQPADDPGKVLAYISLAIFFVGMNLIGFVVAFFANKKSKDAGFKNKLAVVMMYIHATWVVLGLILTAAVLAYILSTGKLSNFLSV